MAKQSARERYVVEWQELTAGGMIRHLDADYEHDRDRDEGTLYEVFKTEAEAHTRAKVVARQRTTLYSVSVQLERYLPIEGTTLWDWEPIGEPEFVDG